MGEFDQPTFEPGPEETTAASISRIFQHFSTDSMDKGIAILTSDRSDRAYKTNEKGALVVDEEKTRALNKKAHARLKSLLKSMGFSGWITVKGGYIENKGQEDERAVYENSLVVPSVSLDDAKKLAKVLGKGAQINSVEPLDKKVKNANSLANDFRQESILWGSNKAGAALIDFKGTVDKIGTKFEPSTMSPYFTEWRKRRFAFSSFQSIEYQPISPSDFRQWRRELVTQCMRAGNSL